MRAVIQRVQKASVSVSGNTISEIQQGLLILLSVEEADTLDDITWLSGKIAKMRIFDDHEGLMNQSLIDVNGHALVVSQFTLHAQTKKGNRPSFMKAARPEYAQSLYLSFTEHLGQHIQKTCATGKFGANMQVSLTNDGPVTILMDSKNRE